MADTLREAAKLEIRWIVTDNSIGFEIVNPEPNHTYQMKLVHNGPGATAYVDDVLVDTWPPSPPSEGSWFDDTFVG